MKILKVFMLIFICISFSFWKSNDNQELKIEITKNLRCLICQGQSIYDSDSTFANSVKSLIEKKLNEGFSDHQIYDLLKSKYGQWVLFDPGMSKNTIVLWLLPILLFLIGGAIIFKKLKIKNN